MWRRWTLMSALAASMAGCATSDPCGWAEPIRPSRADVLTEGTRDQVLVHNETGARICGWRP